MSVENIHISCSASVSYPPEVVRRRYDRLAPWYRLFEWILWLPRGIRSRAVQKLEPQHGDTVLEVGCGTGRNLPYLREAVGPGGQVLGVDLSERMLSRARMLCERKGWKNATLVRMEALDYRALRPLDAVLFSLSYSVMQKRERILNHVWSQLRAGGRVVIMDGKTMPGIVGRLLHPLIVLAMKATVLGDPDHNALADLSVLTDDVLVEEELFGAYFIYQGKRKTRNSNRERS